MTYWNKRHSWVYADMVSTDKLKHMGCFTNPFTPKQSFELFSCFSFQNLRKDKGKENYEREQRSSGLNERHLQRQRVNS